MRREFVPIYMITGFLESGKTTLGMTVLENKRFTNGGTCLIIQCEEGEIEYDEAKLKANKGIVVTLDEAEELTTAQLARWETEYKPSCVILEYNNMWGFQRLDEIRLPRLWGWAQVVTTVDATTLANYMTNMRKLLTDPMKTADMIYVNRCGENFDKASWRKQIRALNGGCTILFENLDGSVEDGVRDEDLPYDMKAAVIEISEDQFGTLYLDSMDHPERYDGKTLRIVGQAYRKKEFPPGFYYFGRQAMTCCAEDIQACGWVCKGERTPDNKTYFTLTARGKRVVSPDGRAALMLYEEKTEKAKVPREEFVSFVNI